MKALIACECSGRIRSALRALGYDAWSNDLKPAEDNSPFHIQDDALRAVSMEKWDLLIAHPVCRYLANSGAKHLYIDMKKENGIYQPRWTKMEQGAKFYADLWQADVPFVAIENPIWHKHAKEAVHRLCDRVPHPEKRQFVQPWMFGHKEVKATGFALRRLPPLTPTNNVRAETFALDYAERAKVHYASPGPEREADRSRTLPGLADACAKQWGSFVEQHLRSVA